jgi:hypothetical protein
VAVSQRLSGESIAVRELGFGEAPSDGEFFALSREQANRKARSEGLVLCGQAPLDADMPLGRAVSRELLGSGGDHSASRSVGRSRCAAAADDEDYVTGPAATAAKLGWAAIEIQRRQRQHLGPATVASVAGVWPPARRDVQQP